ncbi:hypothetical protein B0I37DRAFT_353597 [Chaetomium sp. MPI-CAGE-AT-0009]|nr:hypothetical protein B0I37DRAFT_353597 [Chaetomium sp. MPI-CAGE-AT-0009]
MTLDALALHALLLDSRLAISELHPSFGAELLDECDTGTAGSSPERLIVFSESAMRLLQRRLFIVVLAVRAAPTVSRRGVTWRHEADAESSLQAQPRGASAVATMCSPMPCKHGLHQTIADTNMIQRPAGMERWA